MKTLSRCFTLVVLAVCVCSTIFLNHILIELRRDSDRYHEAMIKSGEFTLQLQLKHMEIQHEYSVRRLEVTGVDEKLERLSR